MKRLLNAKTYLAISLLLLCLISTAGARSITVDDDGLADFNNVQAVIDDAMCILFGGSGDKKCYFWFVTGRFSALKAKERQFI